MGLLLCFVVFGVVSGKFTPMDIVGGLDAKENIHPYQVSLQTKSNYHFCGGSLVKTRKQEIVVITASHCLVDAYPDAIQVKVGEHNLNVNGGNFEKVYTLKKIVMHPGYDKSNLNNDIAILFLNEKVKENTGVKAISLADKPTVNWFNKNCTISGWGTTQEEGSVSQILQTATVFMFPDEQCTQSYGNGYTKHTMLCGGMKEGGIDSCQGDSGGPFVCMDHASGEFVLNGVVSWGIGCARPGKPGVYTDVYMMRGWLNARLGTVI